MARYFEQLFNINKKQYTIMKTVSSKLFIQVLLMLICCISIPSVSNAAIIDNSPPVERKKASKSKRQAIKNKRLLKRQAVKKIKDDGYGGVIGAILIIFLMSVATLTGIILLIVGLATANPILWTIGLCLIGAALLTYLIWHIVA